MASSFYSNAQHVDFESVLGMDDHGMVSMFEALMASGLRGFWDALHTVGGQLVEISEKLFAESFELPVDGLGDLSEMPKDVIFDARSIVSLSGEPISLSGRKNQMKMPFRLLCDIMAKAISVKAGSFNAITVEKFSLIMAVVCKIKMNWAKFLFGVLKKMVSAGSKQAKGFAIQISVLLATFPSVELAVGLVYLLKIRIRQRLVGTTAFCLIQEKRSFDNSADALLGVNQQMYLKDSKTASLD
ncbi:midasin [Dorcoceras hygrometricum]|uniref:Midasin n=1 Tax=Dorcoceras hygrometricum TaxID=472368 RepID=A0A2Z7CJW0_9LAMI|nr:midasin [Dorcoceras hygrometricum]